MRKKSATTICFLIVFLSGCNKPATQNPVVPGNTVQSAVEPIESRLADSELPRTPEAFKDEFVRRFDIDNWSAIRDLSYWEGVPLEMQQMNKQVSMIGLGDSRISTATIEPCTPGEFDQFFDQPGVPQKPNIVPTHKLCFETVDQHGEMTTLGDSPVGVKDGVYYFCVGVRRD